MEFKDGLCISVLGKRATLYQKKRGFKTEEFSKAQIFKVATRSWWKESQCQQQSTAGILLRTLMCLYINRCWHRLMHYDDGPCYRKRKRCNRFIWIQCHTSIAKLTDTKINLKEEGVIISFFWAPKYVWSGSSCCWDSSTLKSPVCHWDQGLFCADGQCSPEQVVADLPQDR